MKRRNEQQFESMRVVGGLINSQILRDVRKFSLSGQTVSDYGVEKGLKLSDELGRYWRIARTRWQEYTAQQPRSDINQNHLAVDDWLLPLLSKVLGYEIKPATPRQIGERIFPVTHFACNGHLPLVLCGATFDLDKGHEAFGQEGRKRSPSGLAQEYLNAENNCLWAIVSNGLTLRLLRDNPAMTRPAYLEVDFARLFDEDNFADFSTLWLLLHVSRIASQNDNTAECWLEQWRNQGLDAGERALDSLRYGVADALRVLGSGFVAHSGNTSLREKITAGELTTDAYFQQVLRLVYRLLFLFTSEDRQLALLPGDEYKAARELYLQGYSLSQLRERSRQRRHYDHHGDAWQQLLITFAGYAQGQEALAQPALGGLFADDQCPELASAELENRHLFEAIFNLGFFESKGILSRINYRDMDTEEFGSVYESLLELIPQLHTEGQWHFNFMGDEEDEKSAGGHTRKLTGSYYTPDSLVQELIKSALVPVIEDRLQANPEKPRDALLSITVCDPACGSGHFLLAAARRLATELATVDAGLDQPTDDDYRHALREVVRHCIYGVDINPLAVELCKTGLWLESIEQGKPLSFLDAHIQCGNGLVGILDNSLLEGGIPDDAFKALSGDDKAICTQLKKANKLAARNIATALRMEPLALDYVESMPEETVEQVEAKRVAYQEAQNTEDWQNARLKEDLFTAAFFAPKTGKTKDAVPTNTHLRVLAEGGSLPPAVEINIQTLARTHRFLHWPLAFPTIFGESGKGGFDVMLGNAPWDVSQLSEEEFFASRAPSISELSGAKRKRAIDQLLNDGAPLGYEFIKAKAAVDSQNQFVRASGRFGLTARGKLNLYALFAEHFAKAINSSGRSGIIVPTGISTDDSTKFFFGWLAEGRRLVSLFDFENREAIFKGVHRSYKFCLLTTGQNISRAELSFFATQAHQLNDQRRRFSLTAEEFGLINPNTRTCPTFRSQMDAEITKKIYRSVPVLLKEGSDQKPEVNPWSVSFSQGLFNMTSASHLFKEYVELLDEGANFYRPNFNLNHKSYLPLYEAKMVHQYDHRWATYETDGETSRDCTLSEKQNLDYTVLPRYWVDEWEVVMRTTRAPKAVKDIWELDTPSETLRVLQEWLAGAAQERGDEQLALSLAQQIASYSGRNISGETNNLFASGVISPLQNQSPLSDTEYSQLKQAVEPATPYEELVQKIVELKEFLELLIRNRCPKYLLGWRDICRSTDERTVIVDMFPCTAVGHTLPLIFTKDSAKEYACLIGNLNTLSFDYIARQKVGGTHLTYGYLKQFPVLAPDFYSENDLSYIVPRILKLTYTSHDLKSFAEDFDYYGEPFSFDPVHRHLLKCELDAYYAKLYGLTRDELRYILDPAVVMGEDYPSETFRVLKNKELKEFGEFRTQRLVLEAWDKLERGELA